MNLRRFGAQSQAATIRPRDRLQLGVLVRREVAAGRRTSDAPAALVDFEPVVLRVRPHVAQMPFAGKERPVAGFAKCFGQRDVFVRQLMLVMRGEQRSLRFQAVPVSAADPIGNASPSGIFSRHDAGARWATNLARRVTLCGIAFLRRQYDRYGAFHKTYFPRC